MNWINKKTLLTAVFICVISLWGCTGSSDNETSGEQQTETTSETIVPVDPYHFVSNALVDSIAIETCTLSNGEQADCYRIVIAGVPANHDIGVFCPTDIYSTADEGGIWFDGSGEVYDITGEFILNLANLYNDDKWLLYDPETGLVNVTDTEEKCDGAARPDVEEQYQNHCVVCSIDYVDGGISKEYLIPVTPVAASTFNSLGRAEPGVSLNGVTLAAPAPVDAILGAYTIAAFDDCAGHINLNEGYHYHGAAGCNDIIAQDDGHAAMFGYALDGYGIFAMLDNEGKESTDLDECRGHIDAVRGYHYHAASVAENMFIGCFRGETARSF
ncbi:YHYH protein [Paraglaciecola sp. L3A3]|uniref:YHYH protein n=1 Tax=Paraglaciecola sp. L3A3 TaxID=2686358 RepID=UPI00131B6878|nr:YHYH protein [Paraglaciecola sp. L3A3]